METLGNLRNFGTLWENLEALESLETLGYFWKLLGSCLETFGIFGNFWEAVLETFWKLLGTFEKLWELLETFCNFGNFRNFGNAKDFFDMLLGCGEPAFGVRGTRPGRLGEPGRAHPRGTGPEQKRGTSH